MGDCLRSPGVRGAFVVFCQTWSATVCGIEGIPVRVEVNRQLGLPTLSVVGLPQGAVREGRDRVQAALRNSGWTLDQARITVNLAPADLKKEGSGFDLPMALGLLGAMGVVPADRLQELMVVGELGLDGGIRPVRGVLPVALACLDSGPRTLMVPAWNALEARAAGDALEVIPASDLGQVVGWLRAGSPTGASLSEFFDLSVATRGERSDGTSTRVPDLAGVVGQPLGRRAVEIAAAGGHNLLLSGPPGTGKTLLARCLPGILPPLSAQRSREATAVHSVSGLLPEGAGLLRTPPFRAPHHGISSVGLIGGGSPLRPGEVSLAHGGVLFLDELPEFGRNTLESLRQPMEDGEVMVVRARARARFPSRFSLVAAMNPCPCGRAGDGDGEPCTCDPVQIRRYRARISGPLMDRLDLHVQVDPVDAARMIAGERGESSEVVRERVRAARTRGPRGSGGIGLNATIPAERLPEAVAPTVDALSFLESAAGRFRISPRGLHRILRVSRTIADLEESPTVQDGHVAEALQFRTHAASLRRIGAGDTGPDGATR